MFQKIAKHRANDASHDVHRTPLPGESNGLLSAPHLLLLLESGQLLGEEKKEASNLIKNTSSGHPGRGSNIIDGFEMHAHAYMHRSL